MSLQLTFVKDGNYPSGCITDPEVAFVTVPGLVLDSRAIEIVRDIEGGDLDISEKMVHKETGDFRLSDISTGCKVALLINSGLAVAMRECGANAFYTILNKCTVGAGYFEDLADEPLGPDDTADVMFNGEHYTRLSDIAREVFLC